MTENISIKEEKKSKAVLVSHVTRDMNENEAEISLSELERLCETAGVEVFARMMQNKESPDPRTYIGKGKVGELSELCKNNEVDTVVFDCELSPSQIRNLEDDIGDVNVIDRSMLILDIFALHAVTGEGKLQVELAQLKYTVPRLVGKGLELSRLGGGVGTRGPGESKLETDRRHVKRRMDMLEAQIAEMAKNREVQRVQRDRSGIFKFAIAGYTNAGKSTLLNRLTDAGILSEDKLFATLDPTTRVLKLSGKQEILLTDTVGFIRKLPHHLIDAFRSTLEEAKYADYILHVVDASNPQMDIQMHVVYETLRELGIRDKKIVTLFNKQDIRTDDSVLRDFRADRTICLSARTKEGLEALKETLEELLREEKIYIERVYDYREAGLLSLIRKKGELLEADYEEDGIHVRAYVPPEIYDKV